MSINIKSKFFTKNSMPNNEHDIWTQSVLKENLETDKYTEKVLQECRATKQRLQRSIDEAQSVKSLWNQYRERYDQAIQNFKLRIFKNEGRQFLSTKDHATINYEKCKIKLKNVRAPLSAGKSEIRKSSKFAKNLSTLNYNSCNQSSRNIRFHGINSKPISLLMHRRNYSSTRPTTSYLKKTRGKFISKNIRMLKF